MSALAPVKPAADPNATGDFTEPEPGNARARDATGDFTEPASDAPEPTQASDANENFAVEKRQTPKVRIRTANTVHTNVEPVGESVPANLRLSNADLPGVDLSGPRREERRLHLKDALLVEFARRTPTE